MGDAAHRRGALRVCYAVFLNSKIVAERDCRVSYAYIARDMAFIEAKCRDLRPLIFNGTDPDFLSCAGLCQPAWGAAMWTTLFSIVFAISFSLLLTAITIDTEAWKSLDSADD